MKRSLAILLAASLAIGGLSSCKRNITEGKGESISESRNVGQFDKIELAVSVDANIQVNEGAPAALELKGYKNILQNIKTEIKGTTLRIYSDDFFHFTSDKNIVANISVPSLSGVTITGSGNAVVKGMVKADKLTVEVTGSGDISVDNVMANSFEAELSGAGGVSVKQGVVNTSRLEVTGAGDIKAFGLQSQTTDVTVTGAGDVEVSAQKKLNAEITGAGDVKYKGQPQISSDITGAGSIEEAR